MNLPSYISLLRGAACLFFISDSTAWRTFAIVFAGITDYLDGYLARRLNQMTPLGTLLDPLMDKLFVAVVLSVFWLEGSLQIWQVTLFLSRDMSLFLFTGYLWLSNRYRSWKIRSFISGKLMTTLQFVVLVLLAQNQTVPMALWALLASCGIASFFELFWLSKSVTESDVTG